MNYITIANFTHGGSKIRGLQTLADIPANSTLIAVPRALFITGEDVDPQEFSIPVRDMQENSDLFLAVRFWQLFSRGRSSQWFPYLRLLPSSDEYARFHPMYADDVVMQACSALPTIQKVRRARRRVERTFKEANLQRRIPWQAFWHSYVTYISRSYGVVMRSRQGDMKWQPVSVPVADMGNTASQGEINTRWRYDSRSQLFLLESTKAIPAGSELFESYQISSLKDNAHLAYMFGLTLDDNPVKVKRLTPQECLKLEEDCLSAAKSQLSQLLRTLVREHCDKK